MSEPHNYVVIPFVLAFLLSVKRFYFREAAGSVRSPSFLLAAGSMVLTALYMALGALHMLPAYSTIGFGVVGLIFCGVAVWQAFQL